VTELWLAGFSDFAVLEGGESDTSALARKTQQSRTSTN
jgi:hypothetical protein